MTLVPLVEKSETSGEARQTLDRGEEMWGQVLNTWKALANTPGILTTYLPFLRSVAGPGALDQRIKELVAVQVAIDNHCLYTASHRCASALKQGVSETELTALARGDLSGFTEDARLAVAIARDLTLQTPQLKYDQEPQILSADLIDRAQHAFSPEALVELILGISVWNALARFHRTLGLPLDMAPPPAAVRDAL